MFYLPPHKSQSISPGHTPREAPQTRTHLAYSFALTLFLAVPFRSEAQSIVPDTNQDPNTVEQLGFPTAYYVDGVIPGYPYSVTWYWQQTDASSYVFPRSSPYSGNNVFNYSYPGTFQLIAIITYGSVSRPGGQAPPNQSATKTVTIQTPTLDRIVPSVLSAPLALKPAPNAQPTGPNEMGGSAGQWVYFVLKSNGKTIGPQLSPIGAQERLTNFLYFNDPKLPEPDSPWRPGNPTATDARDRGYDNCFNFNDMNDGTNDWAIFDFKTIFCNQDGFVGILGSYDQEIRIQWVDQSGSLRQSPVIAKQHWIFNGIGNGTWNDTYQNLPTQ